MSASSTAMASSLVIVESPAKASTIQKILPNDTYEVRSCVGHIRELPSSAKRIPAKYKDRPWSRLGVDIENGFQPLYVLIAGKQKIITELKSAMQNSNELILATDEDREGEAISWHLLEVLKPNIPIKRAVFHEITPEAIRHGIETGRDIDLKLVEAQETRRILDRLAGYTMSPLLWKKISRGLSAGRVQSVALSLIVGRELDRLRFMPAVYYDAVASFSCARGELTATLVSVSRKRLARGSDFDHGTGKLSSDALQNGVVVLGRDEVDRILKGITNCVVSSVQKSRVRKKPPLPFTTSTLQQECGNKLGMSAGRTMRVAQRLYENGFITYMRTDNSSLSDQAITASRRAVQERFGSKFLAKDSDRKSATLSKSVQGAHEAIRPAGVTFHPPESVPLEDPDEKVMYSLIYRRTIASQMAVAEYDTTTISVEAHVDNTRNSGGTPIPQDGQVVSLRATGRVTVFLGFLKAYQEYQEVTAEDGANDQNQDLPDAKKGDSLTYLSGNAVSHQTKAKPRFTDASLVKELEEVGVGRPSTYASIIEKLVDRAYIFRGKDLREENSGISSRALVPSLTAFAVDNLLSTHFPEFVDAGFTANMEEALDSIARGRGKGVSYLTEYYLGEDGLAATVERTEKHIDDYAFRQIALPGMPALKTAHAEDTRSPPKAKGTKSAESLQNLDLNKLNWKDLSILVGPHGPYVEYRGNVVASLPRTILAEHLTEERLKSVLELAKDPVIGTDPSTGTPILVKTSKFGPYVQYGRDDDVPAGEKPRRQSLLPGMDVGDLTLELALQLLSLPRLLGHHPETGKEVRASIGPFGPYVVHESPDPMYANLKKDQHDLFSIDLSQALDLLKQVEERKEKRALSAAGKSNEESVTSDSSEGSRQGTRKTDSDGSIDSRAGPDSPSTTSSVTPDSSRIALSHKPTPKRTSNKRKGRKSTAQAMKS